jgi:DNA polymerase III subunit epsilon
MTGKPPRLCSRCRRIHPTTQRCAQEQGHADADIAKRLRSQFILEYCRAVYVPIDGTKSEIERLEAEVIRIAPSSHVRWNRATDLNYPEPTDLVDALIEKLRLSQLEREAVERQRRLAAG